MEVRGKGARLSQTRQASAEAPAEIEALAEAFEQVQYSARPISEREAGQAGAVWARLRRRLWWLWLARAPRTAREESAQPEDRHEP